MICNTCKEDVCLDNFPMDKRRLPHKPRTTCYKCCAISNKKSRQKNLQQYALHAKLRRNQRKLEAIQYKGGQCENCKQVVHQAAFDFHHVNPEEKESDPGLMLGLTKEKLFKELDKCVLLCSNCHRIFHFENG